MKRSGPCALLPLALSLLSLLPHGLCLAQPESSTAFCLFELPTPSDRRVWLNLGIVQYIEQRPGELVIYYGGGHFGAGHEARIAVRNPEEALAFLARMQAAAARCAGK